MLGILDIKRGTGRDASARLVERLLLIFRRQGNDDERISRQREEPSVVLISFEAIELGVLKTRCAAAAQ